MSVASGELQMQYDEEHDVLYITFGDPRPGYGMPEEDMDSLVVRRDAKTHEIIGFTIIGLRKLDRTALRRKLPVVVDLNRFL